MAFNSFRLPGEAQQIDKFMCTFAEYYTASNMHKHFNADGVYVLCFSMIMLSTNVNNPYIKARITRSDFIKNQLFGPIDYGFTEEFLTDIYNKITERRITEQ